MWRALLFFCEWCFLSGFIFPHLSKYTCFFFLPHLLEFKILMSFFLVEAQLVVLTCLQVHCSWPSLPPTHSCISSRQQPHTVHALCPGQPYALVEPGICHWFLWLHAWSQSCAILNTLSSGIGLVLQFTNLGIHTWLCLCWSVHYIYFPSTIVSFRNNQRIDNLIHSFIAKMLWTVAKIFYSAQ